MQKRRQHYILKEIKGRPAKRLMKSHLSQNSGMVGIYSIMAMAGKVLQMALWELGQRITSEEVG